MSGWGFVFGLGGSQSKKAHYFADSGRSLCGKWMRFNLDDLEDAKHGSHDNCNACERKRKKLVLKQYGGFDVGGPNHVSNLGAAHEECNHLAGHLSVSEKVLLRERMRAE